MSDMSNDGVVDFDTAAADETLEQLQPEDTLVDRGVEDVLDEGYVAPDEWSPAEGYGNTAEEMREGETLDQRLKQEVPDVLEQLDELAEEDDLSGLDAEVAEIERADALGGDTGEIDLDGVGVERAGRLVADSADGAMFGDEVGIDGAAASAEEAAVHVVDPTDDLAEVDAEADFASYDERDL